MGKKLDKIKQGVVDSFDYNASRDEMERKNKEAGGSENIREGNMPRVEKPKYEKPFLELSSPEQEAYHRKRGEAVRRDYRDEASAKRAELMAKYKGDVEAAYADREWDAGWLHPSKYTKKLKVRRNK